MYYVKFRNALIYFYSEIKMHTMRNQGSYFTDSLAQVLAEDYLLERIWEAQPQRGRDGKLSFQKRIVYMKHNIKILKLLAYFH